MPRICCVVADERCSERKAGSRKLWNPFRRVKRLKGRIEFEIGIRGARQRVGRRVKVLRPVAMVFLAVIVGSFNMKINSLPVMCCQRPLDVVNERFGRDLRHVKSWRDDSSISCIDIAYGVHTDIFMESAAGDQSVGNDVLRDVLLNLSRTPYPHVTNPPECPKRAAVALILRIRPHTSNWPTGNDVTKIQDKVSTEDSLSSFFNIPWVRQGDAEILFIKRAARVGDRWTSHVALPGGKRDPEDLDDRHAAVRETSEEVGLDIGGDETVSVGNLPERVVTTSWGTIPFVFAQTRGINANLK
jgi:8-oxo-dGTP pyrophosphatase MutT (NUDIX family)